MSSAGAAPTSAGAASMIPHRIHQIWRDAEVPPRWAAAVASWRRHHRDFAYDLWTDDAARELVARERPSLLAAYDAFPYAIQRADAFRYTVLWALGGVYADLDVEALRSVAPLLTGASLILCREPETHAPGGRRSPACNAFLAAPPRHRFLERVLGQLEQGAEPAVTHLDVLRSTGPIFLDDLLAADGGEDVVVLESRLAYPLSHQEDRQRIATLEQNGPGAERVREELRAGGSFVVHYWANSWVGELAGPLDNPRPHELPGYKFFPGWDAPDHDLGNIGREVGEAARRCDGRRDAAGFNTDGFLKALAIVDLPWKRRQRVIWNQGLYVKDAVWKRRSRWRSMLFAAIGRRPVPG